MLRSTKPTIKKQEVKQTVDQDTLDNLKYLGDLDDLVAQAEQRKNMMDSQRWEWEQIRLEQQKRSK